MFDLSFSYHSTKRAFDLILASLGLLLSWPLFVVIAIGVVLDSPGPVFFRQTRLGRGGKKFEMIKFRKFPVDLNDQGPGVTLRDDPRMTRFGAFLERTKLDEIPQLWNILVGEMSFLGPRPESLNYEDLFVGPYLQLLDYRPGIFGPSQVAYRNESLLYPEGENPEAFYRANLFPVKAQIDLDYFSRATLQGDIYWVVKGVLVSLFGVVGWREFIGIYWRIALLDAALVAIAWVGAILTRFWGMPGQQDWLEIGALLLVAVPCTLVCLALGGVYRKPLRYFSLFDAMALIRTNVLASMSILFLTIKFIDRGFPLGVCLLEVLYATVILALPRLVRRLVYEYQTRPETDRARAVVVGEGAQAEALAGWLETIGCQVHGLVVKDSLLGCTRLGRYKVLGRFSDLWLIVRIHQIKLVFTADFTESDQAAWKHTLGRTGVKVIQFPLQVRAAISGL